MKNYTTQPLNWYEKLYQLAEKQYKGGMKNYTTSDKKRVRGWYENLYPFNKVYHTSTFFISSFIVVLEQNRIQRGCGGVPRYSSGLSKRQGQSSGNLCANTENPGTGSTDSLNPQPKTSETTQTSNGLPLVDHLKSWR